MRYGTKCIGEIAENLDFVENDNFIGEGTATTARRFSGINLQKITCRVAL